MIKAGKVLSGKQLQGAGLMVPKGIWVDVEEFDNEDSNNEGDKDDDSSY